MIQLTEGLIFKDGILPRAQRDELSAYLNNTWFGIPAPCAPRLTLLLLQGILLLPQTLRHPGWLFLPQGAGAA